MDLQNLISFYKTETDLNKKFEVLRKILVLSLEKKDPNLNFWIREILKYKPQEIPLSSLITCSHCKKMMKKTKTVKVPPRAEFNYFNCENCKIDRVVAYLTPYSKGLVHLQDRSIYTDLDQLRKFIDAHYDSESRPILEKISIQSGICSI
jgi:hypothetical protein